MALKATVIKADMQISDMNRNYYAEHSLTLAQHPSETDERLLMRLVAFALNANEHLAFTKGISTEDEPDIWQKDFTDHINLWIELGQVDEKRIRKACNKSDRVVIYTYQPYSARPWWQKIESSVARFENLEVFEIQNTSATPIESLIQRSMQVQCNIQDNTVYLSTDSGAVELLINKLK